MSAKTNRALVEEHGGAVPERDAIERAALQAFFGITGDWGLDAEQQRILLGSPSRSAFYTLKRDLAGRLSVDQLDRISYVMGIHKALSILLPEAAAVRRWIHAANGHPLFAGRSALDKMSDGHIQDLAEIRRYLDAERGV
jgi:hypothetical protein